MKKLVFATQVFSILAMLPLVVILEMRHTKTSSLENNSTSGLSQQMEIGSNRMPEQRDPNIEKKDCTNTSEIFLFFNVF